MLKIPPFPTIQSIKEKEGESEHSENGKREYDRVLNVDSYILHKIQVFLRRLAGGFPGPDVDEFISPARAPSRQLNHIEQWMVKIR